MGTTLGERRPSARSERKRSCWRCIEWVHADSHGYVRQSADSAGVVHPGVRVGRNRVARLMRKHQIRARAAKIYRATAAMHVFFEEIPKQRLKVLSGIRIECGWETSPT